MNNLTEQESRLLVTIGNKLSNIALDLQMLNSFLEHGIDNYEGHTKEDVRNMYEAINVVLRVSCKAQDVGKKDLYK